MVGQTADSKNLVTFKTTVLTNTRETAKTMALPKVVAVAGQKTVCFSSNIVLFFASKYFC